MLAQVFEKSTTLKYYAEPIGAITYLKMLYFPKGCTIVRISI